MNTVDDSAQVEPLEMTYGLTFLPWVVLNEPLEIAHITLEPYDLELGLPESFHGVPLAKIEQILSCYGNYVHFSDSSVEAVKRATLISWADDVDGLPLSRLQITKRLDEASYIACAAISARRFGNNYLAYTNSAAYLVVVQPFEKGRADMITVSSRRRGGGGLHYMSAENGPRFIRPFHVTSLTQICVNGEVIPSNFDVGLAEALLQLSDDHPAKSRIDDSIQFFLQANTDDPTMTTRIELVLLRTAFDQLLDSEHDRKGFIGAISKHFKADLPSDPVWASGPYGEAVWKKYKEKERNPAGRPLEAWCHDFTEARNAAAHAKVGKDAPVWPDEYNLLFGSWLFPLVLKSVLAEAGVYRLTDLDRAYRSRCEEFIGPDLLQPITIDPIVHREKIVQRVGPLHWEAIEQSISRSTHLDVEAVTAELRNK